ncbi:MAG: hypothetical protein HFH74_12255 [Lachnospiraceae bacterium]|jgi:heme/copper-type cytochrome/quinol oxidase subunit 4|nr:hypothetical protein [Lachnospiraceae bacterium]
MKSNNTFLTIVICILLTILRIYAERDATQNSIVFIINIVALAYVLWVIFNNVYIFLKGNKDKNQFWKERYRRYIRFIVIFIIVIVIILAIYIFVILNVTTIKSVAGCINDILAIITLGISIEDSKIVEKIKNYYEKLT